MKLRTSLAVFILLFVIVADQIIKYVVKTNMCLFDKIQITDWFYIFFTENRGMAFGMEFLATDLLSIFRLIAVGFFSNLLFKQIKRKAPVGFIICLAMIIAGAFGNIIDNCFYGLCFSESIPRNAFWDMPAQPVSFGEGYGSFLHGHVVDMFYFPLFRWPESLPLLGGKIFFGAVFNLADAAISVGSAVMFLFYYKYVSNLLSVKEKAFLDGTDKE